VTAQQSWVPLATDPWTATLEYSFGGGGTATALAVDVGGGLLVASPPCRVGDDALAALASRAPVRALVATNAYHTLGLARWKARFPDAAVFAPPQSLQRVTKVSGLGGIRPLGEAAPLTGERVALIELPYFRTGEALIKIRAAEGLLWYVTDIILNLPRAGWSRLTARRSIWPLPPRASSSSFAAIPHGQTAPPPPLPDFALCHVRACARGSPRNSASHRWAGAGQAR
jgi:hypothetical protein